jgi:hypothetical protein
LAAYGLADSNDGRGLRHVQLRAVLVSDISANLGAAAACHW